MIILTNESWKKLKAFFFELDFEAPVDTIAQFRLADGYSFEGRLYTMSYVERDDGENETAATIEILSEGESRLDTFALSEFAWAKFNDREWKDE